MAASRNTWQSIQRLPKTNHDSLQSRLAGILAAFFLYLYSTCIKFSKYIISALTFYLQAVFLPLRARYSIVPAASVRFICSLSMAAGATGMYDFP
jgi:hypothetical protein